MNILVVDDELGLRHTLTLILGAEGHETRAAATGEAAMALLDENDADLILCDVRMPGMDGPTFLERYRERAGRALIIMMSAYGDDDDALGAIKRGAYDFIQKPFRADQVLLVVRKAIEREGLRRQVVAFHLAGRDTLTTRFLEAFRGYFDCTAASHPMQGRYVR